MVGGLISVQPSFINHAIAAEENRHGALHVVLSARRCVYAMPFRRAEKQSNQIIKALDLGFLPINRIMQTFSVLVSLALAGSTASQQIWHIVSVAPQSSSAAHTCF